MLKEFKKLMPSIFKLDDEIVDVTTEEGIEAIRKKVANAKNLVNSSLSTALLDKETLKYFSDELDEILERAEQEYAETHSENKEQVEEDVRPILLLKTEEASDVYDMVDAYLKDQIYPKLPKDTTKEFINSVRESLADFAAWCINTENIE